MIRLEAMCSQSSVRIFFLVIVSGAEGTADRVTLLQLFWNHTFYFSSQSTLTGIVIAHTAEGKQHGTTNEGIKKMVNYLKSLNM